MPLPPALSPSLPYPQVQTARGGARRGAGRGGGGEGQVCALTQAVPSRSRLLSFLFWALSAGSERQSCKPRRTIACVASETVATDRMRAYETRGTEITRRVAGAGERWSGRRRAGFERGLSVSRMLCGGSVD
eukprot:1086367-Rhodomonas_salina.2